MTRPLEFTPLSGSVTAYESTGQRANEINNLCNEIQEYSEEVRIDELAGARRGEVIAEIARKAVEVAASDAPRFQKVQTIVEAAANTHSDFLIDLADKQLVETYPLTNTNPDINQLNAATRSEYLFAIQNTDHDTPFPQALLNAELYVDKVTGRSYDKILADTEYQAKIAREQDALREEQRRYRQAQTARIAAALQDAQNIADNDVEAVAMSPSEMFDDDEPIRAKITV